VGIIARLSRTSPVRGLALAGMIPDETRPEGTRSEY
jgi:hypothetical protein